MRIYIEMEPQIKAPRVAPLEGASTSTVAPVDVAHTYGPRHTWRYVSMHCGGHDADERRFIDTNSQRISVNDREKILQERNGTRMTRIGRIFTDPRLINRAGGA